MKEVIIHHSKYWATKKHAEGREDRILGRYVRARLDGAFRSDLEMARHCHAELQRLYRAHGRGSVRPKTFSTIYTYLRRRLCDAGVPKRGKAWTPAEDRLIRRFTGALIAGRHVNAHDAARACQRALLAARRRAPGRFAGTAPRTLQAVCDRVALFSRLSGVPSPQRPWAPGEERIVTRHARRVIGGSHPSTAEATQACLEGLQRYWERLRRRSPQRVEVAAGRSYIAVLGRLHLRLNELGWHGDPTRRWTAEERRLSRKWLRRYLRTLESDTPWTLQDTARSLQDDLAARGFRRTLPACWAELALRRQAVRDATDIPSGTGAASFRIGTT